MNALAEWLPLGGLTTQQVSERYPNLFTPAGFTFGIWGLLYLGQLLFPLYQSGLLGRSAPREALVLCLGPWPALVGLLNGLWLLAWHHLRPITALWLMLALLLCLIVLHRRTEAPADWKARWFTQVPFRLYLGWISVATIANATAVLVRLGFDGWGLPEEIWAALLVAVAAVLALAMLLRHRDQAFAAVVVWALLGIFVRHTVELVGQYQPVILSTVLALILVPGAMAYTFLSGKHWDEE
jgi:hypothetical protein